MPTTIIVRGPDDAVLRFAADELASYATRITGGAVGRGEPGSGRNIVLRTDPGLGPGDAFLLRSAPDGLVVSAAAARGIL